MLEVEHVERAVELKNLGSSYDSCKYKGHAETEGTILGLMSVPICCQAEIFDGKEPKSKVPFFNSKSRQKKHRKPTCRNHKEQNKMSVQNLVAPFLEYVKTISTENVNH